MSNVGQTRRMSVIETLVGTMIGILVTLGASFVVYPLFGHAFTLQENLGITAIFTILSVVRGYWVRRLFNWMWRKSNAQQPKESV